MPLPEDFAFAEAYTLNVPYSSIHKPHAFHSYLSRDAFHDSLKFSITSLTV